MSQENMVTRNLLINITLSAAVIGAALYMVFSPSPGKAMEKVSAGSTYKELLSIAGTPSYETDGTLWVEPEYKKSKDQIIKGCVREVWYESFLNLIPSKYAFCFDVNNVLLNKYHWSSW